MGSFVIGVFKKNDRTTRIHIMDMLHVSKLQVDLLLVSKFLSKRLKVQFHVNKCIVGDVNGDMVIITQREGNLYQMTFKEVCGADAANFMHSLASSGRIEFWHCRLGHLDVVSVFAFHGM